MQQIFCENPPASCRHRLAVASFVDGTGACSDANRRLPRRVVAPAGAHRRQRGSDARRRSARKRTSTLAAKLRALVPSSVRPQIQTVSYGFGHHATAGEASSSSGARAVQGRSGPRAESHCGVNIQILLGAPFFPQSSTARRQIAPPPSIPILDGRCGEEHAEAEGDGCGGARAAEGGGILGEERSCSPLAEGIRVGGGVESSGSHANAEGDGGAAATPEQWSSGRAASVLEHHAAGGHGTSTSPISFADGSCFFNGAGSLLNYGCSILQIPQRGIQIEHLMKASQTLSILNFFVFSV